VTELPDKHSPATACEVCRRLSDFETRSAPARFFCADHLPCEPEPRNVRAWSLRGEEIITARQLVAQAVRVADQAERAGLSLPPEALPLVL
jgi:hypothetical protein